MFHSPASAALDRLLDDSLQFPPEYADQLSSHLPMALSALLGLGADEARMTSFFATYTRRFKTQAPTVAADPVPDWALFRGRFEAFEPLRATFAAALQREGRDAVLRQALPGLVSGVGAAAFHGAIRVGHAVEAGHQGELAAALAYWGARWMPLPPPASVEPDIDNVGTWLDALDSRLLRDDAGWRSRAPLIMQRMQDVATPRRTVRRRAGFARLSEIQACCSPNWPRPAPRAMQPRAISPCCISPQGLAPHRYWQTGCRRSPLR